jgi:DNA repair protein RadC
MEINHDGHRERLRERCRKSGYNSLSEYEKLELLLFAYVPRKNTNDIAHILIDTFGSFANVLDAREEDLLQVKGMTAIAALYLSTLPDIVISYRVSKAALKHTINNASGAMEYFKINIGMRTTEVMQILCMNIKNQLIHTISLEGKTPDSVEINMSALISEIVRHNAKNIIVGHNHPSGDVAPSRHDLDFIRSFDKALSILSIDLLDSIIVGGDDCFSFRDAELINASDTSFGLSNKVANTFFGWGKK